MKKIISVVSKGTCVGCRQSKPTINDLCDSCTLKKFGRLMPWLNENKRDINDNVDVTKNNIFK
jgi:hypothetical protein